MPGGDTDGQGARGAGGGGSGAGGGLLEVFGATAIKLNRTETEKVTRLPVRAEGEYGAAAEWLMEKLQLEAAIVTLDKNGSYVAARDGDAGGGCRRGRGKCMT